MWEKLPLSRSIVDEKGRIMLPKRLRNGLGLVGGSQVSLELEDERLIVSRILDPDEFIRDMEDFIKDDSTLRWVAATLSTIS